ncbi:hypothetical protein IAD21_03804 [Abditibacteriota bacterium]|nr:hypothetical protein IAD21_03804 [Abditibacteriota bacterium]
MVISDQEGFAELRRRIERARPTVEQDTHHELSYGHVMSILSMFGPRLEEGVLSAQQAQKLGISPARHRAALRGWQRRAWNALLCAEKILPLWSVDVVKPYLSPEDVIVLQRQDLKHRILDAKMSVLLQQPFPISIPEFSGDNLTSAVYNQVRVLIPVYQASESYSVIERVLFVAGGDELNTFDVHRTYPSRWVDDDQDWYGVPSAIWASYTFAGSAEGDYAPIDDAQKRREFWLWWLDEAVPASWNFRTE